MSSIPLRRQNLLSLFVEFVAQRQAAQPGVALAGLDKAFAAHLQIHNTYLSGMKSGARGIGNKLAHQIEAACSKPRGWLDEVHVPDEMDVFLAVAKDAYLAASPERRRILLQLLRSDLG